MSVVDVAVHSTISQKLDRCCSRIEALWKPEIFYSILFSYYSIEHTQVVSNLICWKVGH
jgi:hypothetical protein